MRFIIKIVNAAIIVGLLVTSLTTQVFAKSSLISEMADLDQAIISTDSADIVGHWKKPPQDWSARRPRI